MLHSLLTSHVVFPLLKRLLTFFLDWKMAVLVRNRPLVEGEVFSSTRRLH